jgi:hypothetical protein
MARESLTGNGHAASPRHFHHRYGPVYGLARTWRAAFPCAHRAQWLEVPGRGIPGAPTLAYRCGGSTGLAPVSRLTRREESRAGTRCRVRAGTTHGSAPRTHEVNCRRRPGAAPTAFHGAARARRSGSGLWRPVSRLRLAREAVGGGMHYCHWACQTTFKNGCYQLTYQNF